ncbi:recG, partial [Symbiodinium sp. CCMP2456]
VKYKNLGLAVVDEQHRFGVAQRAKLWKKNTLPPHILVMTATPIPRTLAMSVYGNLDLSVIDELPPGRKPIKTVHRYDSNRLQVFGFMKEEIEKGRQCYVVYPLIEESEKMDYKDLMDGYESIVRTFEKPKYQVSIVHGKMKPEDKEIEMQRFVKGETQIMVATTVIEVGVNVPNASVMVIESAERFGLSQLHQLRGRVGRGAEKSYCILMSSHKLSNDAKTRLKTMVRTQDGFEIAEVDMKLRGPGDMMGTRQSGVLNLQLADLTKDEHILKQSLLYTFAYRDYRARYAQTMVGFGWAILQPIISLLVLFVLFQRVLQTNTQSISFFPYALSGLIFWTYFNFVVGQAASSLINAQRMLQKIYFPRPILPLSKGLVDLVEAAWFQALGLAALAIFAGGRDVRSLGAGALV